MKGAGADLAVLLVTWLVTNAVALAVAAWFFDGIRFTGPVRGGVEEVVLALLQRLDPSEFRVALAAPQALLDSFAGGLHGVAVETEAVQAESWTRRRDVGRLSAFIGRVRPHIVNPHLFRSTVVAAPLAKWHGARVVETYHGREGWRRGLIEAASSRSFFTSSQSSSWTNPTWFASMKQGLHIMLQRLVRSIVSTAPRP